MFCGHRRKIPWKNPIWVFSKLSKRKFRFWIFEQNHDFLELAIFEKIKIISFTNSSKNRNFRKKVKFSPNMENFPQKWNAYNFFFWNFCVIYLAINFDRFLNFSLKVELFVKNRNLRQKKKKISSKAENWFEISAFAILSHFTQNDFEFW